MSGAFLQSALRETVFVKPTRGATSCQTNCDFHIKFIFPRLNFNSKRRDDRFEFFFFRLDILYIKHFTSPFFMFICKLRHFKEATEVLMCQPFLAERDTGAAGLVTTPPPPRKSFSILLLAAEMNRRETGTG